MTPWYDWAVIYAALAFCPLFIVTVWFTGRSMAKRDRKSWAPPVVREIPWPPLYCVDTVARVRWPVSEAMHPGYVTWVDKDLDAQ